MKINRIYSGNYQRNGISGNGFFSCFFDWACDGETGNNFLITFEPADDESSEFVKIESVRVIGLKNPTLSWRGDEFGYALNWMFKREGVIKSALYDYITTK